MGRKRRLAGEIIGTAGEVALFIGAAGVMAGSVWYVSNKEDLSQHSPQRNTSPVSPHPANPESDNPGFTDRVKPAATRPGHHR